MIEMLLGDDGKNKCTVKDKPLESDVFAGNEFFDTNSASARI